MGGAESREAAKAAPAPRRFNEHAAHAFVNAHSLRALGIVPIANKSELRGAGFEPCSGFPVYVPRKELGQCVVTYKCTEGLRGEHLFYVMRVSCPRAAEGGDVPLAQQYWRVPRHVYDMRTRASVEIATHLPFAIVKFRPPAAGAETERERVGYVHVLTSGAVRYEVSWPVLMLALTVHKDDADIDRKIAIMAHPLLETAVDVANLQRAAVVLYQHEPDVASYVAVHENDTTAWGDMLRNYASSDGTAAPRPAQTSIASSLVSR